MGPSGISSPPQGGPHRAAAAGPGPSPRAAHTAEGRGAEAGRVPGPGVFSTRLPSLHRGRVFEAGAGAWAALDDVPGLDSSWAWHLGCRGAAPPPTSALPVSPPARSDCGRPTNAPLPPSPTPFHNLVPLSWATGQAGAEQDWRRQHRHHGGRPHGHRLRGCLAAGAGRDGGHAVGCVRRYLRCAACRSNLM